MSCLGDLGLDILYRSGIDRREFMPDQITELPLPNALMHELGEFPWSEGINYIPTAIALILFLFLIPRLAREIGSFRKGVSLRLNKDFYIHVIQPEQERIISVILLLFADLTVLIAGQLQRGLDINDTLEIGIGILAAIGTVVVGFGLIRRFFDYELYETSIGDKKINKELFIVANWLSNFFLIIVVSLVYCQVHGVNLLGLIAGLGVGGLAVAFAAQKTLEQFLGGIVIYWDRPFGVGDYIGLPDGTFGKVESIGIRSSRIRCSGKGTVMVVPNNNLTSINIENYTEAKKSIVFVNIDFQESIPTTKQAYFRQLIINGFSKVPGLDVNNITVGFQDVLVEEDRMITRANLGYTIPSGGELSTDLRGRMVRVISQDIYQKILLEGMTIELGSQPISIKSQIPL